MGKRILSLILAVLMLLSTDQILYASNMDRQNLTVRESQQGVQTEDQTGVQRYQIYFYDETDALLGNYYEVTGGETVSLNKIANYAVTGYEVSWKNKADGTILSDSQVITGNLNLQAVLTPIHYQIRFHKNATDAVGTMADQTLQYGNVTALKANGYTRKGYVFAGWALTAGGGSVFTDQDSFDGIDYITKKNEVFELYAIWSVDSYAIEYVLNKGTNNKKNPTTYTVNSGTITLEAPTRHGYHFEGWYGDKGWKIKSDTIKAGSTGTKTFYAKWSIKTYKIRYKLNGGKNHGGNIKQYKVTTDDFKLLSPTRQGYTFKGWYTEAECKNRIKVVEEGSYGNLNLYAKWELTAYKITYKLNGGKNNANNPKTYSMTSRTVTLKKPTRSGYYFAGWYTDKQYTKKASGIKKGSVGTKTFYARWIKEYAATTTATEITSCKATGTGRITIKAKAKNRIESDDTKYYLVTVDANSGKVLDKVASCGKKESMTFKVSTKKNRGYALARYALAVKKGDRYRRISKASNYITNPEKLAANKASYKYGKTKKGLQTANVDQAIETGAKNMFLNINVSSILSTAATEPATYIYNGKTYHFGALGGYLVQIKKANARNINVTMQINLDQATLNYDSSLIAAEARTPGHLYYAWNTKDTEAREKMEAIFCYLSEVFGQKKCYVSNWILGNEIDSCNVWYYRGSMTDSEYVASYAYAFRSLYNAAKSVKSSTKVYTCIDNIWDRQVFETNGMTAKRFLSTFSKKLERIQSGVKWDISIHPYSVRIDYPEFWDGNSYYCRTDLVNGRTSTEFITMKNLSVFTEYVKKHYGSNKSIIISEIGFDAAKSKTKQAAAIAYAYNIAACNQMVDAFIIRSYVDEKGDGGYRFGIYKRRAYNVFKYMDTPNAESYTKACLKTIGVKKWKVLIKGYSVKKLYRNYRR